MVQHDKAIKKVEEIRYDIERDFKVLVPIALKRMAKDSRSVPTAKRTLHETFNALNVDQGEDTKVLQVIFGIPIQSQTISNTLENNPSDPLFRSTPLKKLLNQKPRQETKVQLVVEYPSKNIKK